MRFQILSIFPELFENFLNIGLVGKARSQGLIDIHTIDIRQFAVNNQGMVDDTPYGGGSGMVMRPEPAVSAIELAKQRDLNAQTVLFSPRGRVFNQQMARTLAENSSKAGAGLILLCSRYEGIDQRVVDNYVDLEISIGDYILMGAEVAAMAFIEAVSRLCPGVLGNAESLKEESFENNLLEHDQYTKPAEFRGQVVPGELLSGNHRVIQDWRRQNALAQTAKRRPEMFKEKGLPQAEVNVALVHYPVTNKNAETITSSITNLDLHDIARSARTFGLSNFYVIHPTKALRRLSEKICEHWESGFGATYNPNRTDALSMLKIVPDLEDMIADIEERTGMFPRLVTTSAKNSSKSISFSTLTANMHLSSQPFVILLGTGWGLGEEVLNRADFHLEPVEGHTDYNHLSVRSAAAIIFDRLFGA